MKQLILLILVCNTLVVAGQHHLLGVKGGINRTNVTASNFLSPNNARTGISTGLLYEYVFKEHLSVGTDLVYNQRGFINALLFTDNLGNIIDEKYLFTFNYDYISLPIKTGVNIGDNMYGFGNVGVIPSLLINAKTISPSFDTDGTISGVKTVDVRSWVTTFDLAGFAEIGGGYKMENNYWLFASFIYQHSFSTLTNSEYFPMSTARHNGMTLNFGLKRMLTKK